MQRTLADWLPILRWGRTYDRTTFAADATAAAIVTLLLIPQSLAYALLAGMPPETGLYASLLPVVLYAVFGSSSQLAVGPTALRSLMSAAAVGGAVHASGASFTEVAALLALVSGLMLCLMGALRLGFVSSFLSHPVLAGFVSAAGLLITASQLKHLLGMPLSGNSGGELARSLWQHAGEVHALTAAVGLGTLVLLWWTRRGLHPLLRRAGLGAGAAGLVTKAAPLLVLIAAIVLSAGLGLQQRGLAVVGTVPSGLPPWTWPTLGADRWPLLQSLLLPALMISLVGFIESVSVSQSMAAKRRERIDPDAELRGLGAANLAAGLTGGFSVGGSFSRSVVNADAGARTPAAGIFTAALLALTALLFTPGLYHLPQAVLAATIVVAVNGLLDFGTFARTWRYSKADFIALSLTFCVTLATDVVSGLITGVLASLLLYLWRTSRPHIATVGRVPGTEHYRNVRRHQVDTDPAVLGLRVDESLYFANARYLEDHVAAEVASHPQVRHVVLQCTAVNDIDASALESLETIVQRLKDGGVRLHLSEVKGPVMDRLQRSDFLQHLSGQVFLTHHQAVTALDSRTADPAALI